MENWTFLTNHAHVLLCVAQDPDIRLRDVAVRVGITERAAQRIIADLQAEGYVTPERIGRRNRYVVHSEAPLRHPMEKHNRVEVLLRLLGAEGAGVAPAKKKARLNGEDAARSGVNERAQLVSR